MLNNVLQYVANRLREPSTYPAMMLIVSGIANWATTPAPERSQILMDIGVTIAGIIGACLPDRIPGQSRASDQNTPEKK